MTHQSHVRNICYMLKADIREYFNLVKQQLTSIKKLHVISTIHFLVSVCGDYVTGNRRHL